MTVSVLDPGAPRKVLLATDLSARCDRAFDRAVSIARRHDARLVIVHVLEDVDKLGRAVQGDPSPSWRRLPNAVATLKQRAWQELQSDLGDAVEKAALRIEEGDPAEVLEEIVRSEQPDVVVTGIARAGLFASYPAVLGKTVEQLLRRLPVPILVVRSRVRSAYRQIVVTTDFQEPSAHALQAALRFLPTQTLHLLHAFEPPYSTLVADADRYRQSFREAHVAELEAFLASIFMSENDRGRLVPLVEVGAPQKLVREFVELHHADLVVLGTRGRSKVAELLLGSTAKSILSTLDCDALVVRGPAE